MNVAFHNGYPVLILSENNGFTTTFSDIRSYTSIDELLEEYPDFSVDDSPQSPAERSARQLKITRPVYMANVNLSAVNIQCVPFNTLGLVKVAEYEKGRKVSVNYFSDQSRTDCIVRKRMSDQLSDTGLLEGINIRFEWLNEAGNVGLTKLESVLLLDVAAQELQEKRRQRALNQIKASAAAYPAFSGFIDTLFTHYAALISAWVFSGDGAELTERLNNEPDGVISKMLQQETINPNDGYSDVAVFLIGELGL